MIGPGVSSKEGGTTTTLLLICDANGYFKYVVGRGWCCRVKIMNIDGQVYTSFIDIGRLRETMMPNFLVISCKPAKPAQCLKCQWQAIG